MHHYIQPHSKISVLDNKYICIYDMYFIEGDLCSKDEADQFNLNFGFTQLMAEGIFISSPFKDLVMMLVLSVDDITKAHFTIDKKFKFKENKKVSVANFRHNKLAHRTELIQYLKPHTEVSLNLRKESATLCRYFLTHLSKPNSPKLVSIDNYNSINDSRLEKLIRKCNIDINDLKTFDRFIDDGSSKISFGIFNLFMLLRNNKYLHEFKTVLDSIIDGFN